MYTHGNDSLDTLCGDWSYTRVYAVASMMQEQMYPGTTKAEPVKSAGFQSGKTEEMRGNKKIKTTKITFVDMAARVKAGINTSIRGI